MMRVHGGVARGAANPADANSGESGGGAAAAPSIECYAFEDPTSTLPDCVLLLRLRAGKLALCHGEADGHPVLMSWAASKVRSISFTKGTGMDYDSISLEVEGIRGTFDLETRSPSAATAVAAWRAEYLKPQPGAMDALEQRVLV